MTIKTRLSAGKCGQPDCMWYELMNSRYFFLRCFIAIGLTAAPCLPLKSHGTWREDQLGAMIASKIVWIMARGLVRRHVCL